MSAKVQGFADNVGDKIEAVERNADEMAARFDKVCESLNQKFEVAGRLASRMEAADARLGSFLVATTNDPDGGQA